MKICEIMNKDITMTWSMESVRAACIFYDLYTSGDCEEYDRMLTYVGEHEFPTTKDIEWVCNDIYFHSNKSVVESVESVLWCILRRGITLQPKD